MARSRNDIGDKLILDLEDLILEREFLLFQAAQGQRIGAGGGLQGVDRVIQIAVFLPQHVQADPQHFLDVQLGRRIHGRITVQSGLEPQDITIRAAVGNNLVAAGRLAVENRANLALAGRVRQSHILLTGRCHPGPAIFMSLVQRT